MSLEYYRLTPPATALANEPRRSMLLGGALLLLLTTLAYLPALRGGFIWDDDYYVVNNWALRSWQGLVKLWTQLGTVPQYYPVTHTSFWIEYHLWGLHPGGYHLVNVLLHAANALLVWRLLSRLEVGGAWLAAAIFALHPVQAESVAWITERKNVLSGLFYLTALGTYLSFVERGHHRAYVLALLLFIAALLSKSVSSSLPAVILLVLWWKRGRIGWRDVSPLVPFFVLGISMGMLTAWMERRFVGAVGPDWDLTVAQRGLIAGRALWFYVGKLFWPSPLIFSYPRWQVDAHVPWQYLAPAGWLLLIVALWMLRRRIGRGVLVAVLFFSGTLVPALGFANTLPMRYSFVADHFQYLASLGLIVPLAWFFSYKEGQGDRFQAEGQGDKGTRGQGDRKTEAGIRGSFSLSPCPLVPLSFLIVLTLGFLTWRQSRIYTNLETLWRDTLAKNPNSWMANNNYGWLLYLQAYDRPLSGQGQEKLRLAREYFHRSVALKGDNTGAYMNLGRICELQGRWDEALGWYRQAARTYPAYPVDSIGWQAGADPHLGQGRVLLAQGRYAEAVREYTRALQTNPDSALARVNLANALYQCGDFGAALEQYRTALQTDPDNVKAHNGMGLILASQGRGQEAEAEFRYVLGQEPASAEACNNLGGVLAKQGKIDEAIEYYRRALRLKPDFAAARRNLAAVSGPQPPQPETKR